MSIPLLKFYRGKIDGMHYWAVGALAHPAYWIAGAALLVLAVFLNLNN